jgi:FkbM family methyltransferase
MSAKMSLRSIFLKFGRVVNDASFVLLEPCSAAERLETLSQLVRIAIAPSLGKRAVVGRRRFRARYLDPPSFWQAYHEVFMRQVYFFASDEDAPLIFDCGANIGLATLYFKTLYPQSRIEAFEPDPLTFHMLKENIESNSLEGVASHQCALWDSEGELDFYTDESSPGRLSMGATGGRLGRHESRIRVSAARLSRFFDGRTVDFLKIDVEGSEERLLADLVKEGRLENVRRMAVEYHPPLDGQRSSLGRVLGMLETGGFDCELYADLRPRVLRDHLHDVLIYARRRS